MKKFRVVDLENNDIVAEGYAESEKEFDNKYDRVIYEYDNNCEGDWIPCTKMLVDGKWVII